MMRRVILSPCLTTSTRGAEDDATTALSEDPALSRALAGAQSGAAS